LHGQWNHPALQKQVHLHTSKLKKALENGFCLKSKTR